MQNNVLNDLHIRHDSCPLCCDTEFTILILQLL